MRSAEIPLSHRDSITLLSTLSSRFLRGKRERECVIRVYASHMLYTHTRARARAHIYIYAYIYTHTLVYLTNQKPGTKNLMRFRIGHMQLHVASLLPRIPDFLIDFFSKDSLKADLFQDLVASLRIILLLV